MIAPLPNPRPQSWTCLIYHVAHIIMSWLINFQLLNLNQQFVSQVWTGPERLLNAV